MIWAGDSIYSLIIDLIGFVPRLSVLCLSESRSICGVPESCQPFSITLKGLSIVTESFPVYLLIYIRAKSNDLCNKWTSMFCVSKGNVFDVYFTSFCYKKNIYNCENIFITKTLLH